MFVVVNMIGEILEVVGLDKKLSNILAGTAERTVEKLKEILEVVDNDDSPF